ncbi:MAG TPA: diguanylate cyclase [Pyrinomonadaceae bacterium]|jgi:diguanylate cyclase (GGDEF)-like protein|nr:diguanylate cyclase [Pyrinomonadaceae bacterium]
MKIDNTSEQDANDLTEERPPLILVADDEPVNLALIKRRLEWEQYKIVTAQNGREAVERARELSPDLIILDVMMPVMDGLEACRILKGTPETRDIPVIFLSALDDTETKVSGLSIGANDYISKPFRTEELLARVSVAIRLKRERDQLRTSAEEARQRAEAASEMSMTDALTGLLNRYGLQRALQREISEARRYARPFSCLMIDIDKFKTINDTYGHTEGDAALMQVARILAEAVRGSDVLCRYGGEEFLVLTPETQLDGAIALGEKIRQSAAARLFGGGERVFPLTLSVGVAELSDTESGHDMIARADVALYYAKEQGRNRVEAARGMGVEG